jgi:hypothetical protein
MMDANQELQMMGVDEPTPPDPNALSPEQEDMMAKYESQKWNRPIPGQAWLADPENPPPYDRPPKYTDFNEAKDVVFDKITANPKPLVQALNSGVTVEKAAEFFLTGGFARGWWEPSLMLLLIEPTLYSILFVAELAGVNYKFTDDMAGRFTDEATQFEMEGSLISKQIQKVADEVESEVEVAGGVEQAAKTNMPSLLAKPEGME